METPADRSQTPQGAERSPRRVIDPDGTVWTEVLEGETTHSPELLDGRIRDAVHFTADPINLTGPLETSCRYAPPIECNAVRVVWSPIVTIDPTQVTCAQCSKRLEGKPLASGGYVSGSQPVLVGEKDGPFLSLADHAELARGKVPQAEIDATADTPIPAPCRPGHHFTAPYCIECKHWYVDGVWQSDGPADVADVHSDDAMLSAVQAQENALTPVADEIRAVLNRYSAEAPSGTPDYTLANYLIDCLKAFNEAVSLRSVWRGEPIEQMILHTDKDR